MQQQPVSLSLPMSRGSVAPDLGVQAGGEVEVLGCDAGATLRFVLAQQHAEHAAAAARVRGVCHWADLHRVEGLGAVDPEVRRAVTASHGLAVHESLLGVEGELRLAHQGAFRVAEFAVTELAAALGLSETAARAYLGQCLELRDRLPRLWQATMATTCPAWKALAVAKQTLPLTAAAADYVDAHLAPFAATMSYLRITRAVDAAILRHDPDQAAARAHAAAEHRGVWVEDRVDGTSMLTAITDTPHATAVDTALNTLATTLGALGDPDPHHVRRAKALGVLADPQHALTLTTTNPSPASQPAAGQPAAGQPARSKGPGAAVVHIHLHTAALTALTALPHQPGEPLRLEPVGRVTGIGPRATAAITRWLADLAPGTHLTLTPVIDQTEHLSIDAYEAPDRLRRLIEERDHTGCRFPWCGRQGRYDLDHITPYTDPTTGGPPAQTNPTNLARLCRFHHRVKTHGHWTYHRTPVGDLLWTSPLGWRYTVDDHGTRPLTTHTLN